MRPEPVDAIVGFQVGEVRAFARGGDVIPHAEAPGRGVTDEGDVGLPVLVFLAGDDRLGEVALGRGHHSREVAALLDQEVIHEQVRPRL